jgi:DNA mismatch repair protein MutL
LAQPADVVLHELDSADAPADGVHAANAYRVYGLLSAPSHSRSNRGLIYLTVNGRAVKDRTLTSALLEACRHFLAPRRFPLAALNVVLPAEEVDINVHPAKAEVRFRAPSRVYSLLHHAVRQAYGIDVHGTPERTAPPLINTPSVSAHAPALLSFAPAGPLLRPSNGSHPIRIDPPTLRVSEAPPHFGALPSASVSAPAPATQPELRSRGDFRIVGQAAGSYILVEDETGLHVIDQHALHERILFERLVQRAHALARGDSQRLLVPLPVELSVPQAALISSASGEGSGLQWLAELGFDCAPFGARTLLVQAVPAILPAHAAARALGDLLDELADPDLTGRAPSGNSATGARQTARWTLREKAAYVLSCKAAIKAGERLTQEQMQALIDEFCLLAGASSLSGHLTCPHGRPLALEVSWAEIQRAVGRS